ncbi:DUF72 domain-containing protein [Autumnicola musiva]|uniref:DUF72 domain-containing protein n=1 Tax=Autumnicola musiva TaxID=3075589 RepID=A0ABU3D2P7_9FLAO|nr:DUF72 domain-containing protein [Zunongwangia sp. F117]MDT0675288.1 DUF72 domain-containing protein [Zunongwangia sp. F117]
MKVFIGCSGWNYKEWRGKFYPEKLAQKNWLEFYAEKFNTAEVNNTFYRFPKYTTLEKWKKTAPKSFNFTLKGSRYITQMKKLKDVEEPVKNFEEVADVMKTKLSCLLWQLPPNLHRNDEKLIKFCKTLKTSNKNVIEFRHESWFDEEVYEILRKNSVSFCSISASGFPGDMIVTRKKAAYVRFHGMGKDWYHYHYSKSELKEWYKKIKDCGAREVYVYFNNDVAANAPKNALELREMFG